MGVYKSIIKGDLICSELSGELDAALANEWVEKLEQQESLSEISLNRFHDVRAINAIHLSFDDLWNIAQRRLDVYKSGSIIQTAFWVSTPLNYGVARMYQALTDGTPFKIEVFYKLDEIADFLNIEQSILENINYAAND